MKKPVNIIVSGDSSNEDVIHVVFSDNSVYRFNYKRRVYHFKFWLLTGMSLLDVVRDRRYLMLNIKSQTLSESGF